MDEDFFHPFATIHDAAIKGVVRELQQFVNEDPHSVNRTDALGATPLMWAAFHGQRSAVELLLNNGADVAVVGFKGITALMMACRKGHWDIASMLLERGADPSVVNDDGSHMLMHAAFGGSEAVLRALLRRPECRGLVNVPSQRGYTALAWACSGGRVGAASVLLLEGGADPEVANAKGETAMDIARDKGHEQCQQLLQWFSEECDRARCLAKARRLADDAETLRHQHQPRLQHQHKYQKQHHPPAYLRRRLEACQALPRVEVMVVEQGGNDVREAVLRHVLLGGLLRDPFTELLGLMWVGGGGAGGCC